MGVDLVEVKGLFDPLDDAPLTATTSSTASSTSSPAAPLLLPACKKDVHMAFRSPDLLRLRKRTGASFLLSRRSNQLSYANCG